MFCFQKDGGIKSLKVETLDPSLGQYDVVWLLHRGEAEGAWQLGQVTSYLVICNYICNHIYVSVIISTYITVSPYLQVNITGRNIVITAAREAGVDTGFVAVDDFLVFAGEDKCATQPEAARWAVIGPAELLTSYWLQRGPGHHHHRGPRRQVPRLQLRDGRVRVELGGQHRQHHRHVRLHQVHI